MTTTSTTTKQSDTVAKADAEKRQVVFLEASFGIKKGAKRTLPVDQAAELVAERHAAYTTEDGKTDDEG